MWKQGFADFTDATVLEVEAATQVKKGGKNKLPPKRKGAGEINPKFVLEDEPNRYLALESDF